MSVGIKPGEFSVPIQRESDTSPPYVFVELRKKSGCG